MADKDEAEVRPKILTTVRFDDPAGAYLFQAGQEDDLLDYLDQNHGDGDEEAGVPSKDDVLTRLSQKGHIVNFVDVDPDETAGDLDQQLTRKWTREKAGEKAPARKAGKKGGKKVKEPESTDEE